MLGKLLKYEFKSTGRTFGAIYIIILVLSVVMGILGRGYMTGESAGAAIGNSLEQARMAAFIFIFVAYIVMIIAMAIVTFVLILERFYRNLLKGEGYLMHTLPVPTWMLVASKMISAVIWNVLGPAAIAVSLVLILLTGGIMQEAMPQMSTLMNGVRDFFALFDMGTVRFFLELLTGAISGILLLYTAMAIGGSAKQHKKTFSILAFIVIVIVITIIRVRLDSIWGISMIMSGASGEIIAGGALSWDIILNIIYSAVFFGLTTLFLQKRLNLE